MTGPSRGFPPVAGRVARVLVLGSLPGRESLRRGQYYAHPRNAFWRIVEDTFGISSQAPYAERVQRLSDAGVALWDVCKAATRPGSLDASIRRESVVANDFVSFLREHPEIGTICLNGGKAAALFRKHASVPASIRVVALPSTSPAHAAMPYAEKLRPWRKALRSP